MSHEPVAQPIGGGHGTFAIEKVDDVEKGTKEMDCEDTSEGAPSDFVFSSGLTTAEANDLLLKYGKNCLPEVETNYLLVYLFLLIEPMPIMIWLAAIIEAAIGNYIDMCILFFILFANASISFYETCKAENAVAELKKSLKPKAVVSRDGAFVTIDATLLVRGDLVQLHSGSAVPADCRVNEGQIDVDQSAQTGESMLKTKFRGDSCLMGSTVQRGETEATVEFTGINTFLGTTATQYFDTISRQYRF